MDLQIMSLLTILFAFLLYVFIGFRITNRISNLPPGPWKLPIIGNLHQLASSLPHHALTHLAKKHGPFMFLKLGQVPTAVVSSPEFAREIMKTHDIAFASRPHILASEIISYGSINLAFSPYGEYWRQLRKICIVELLSSTRVQSFKPVREEEFSKLVEWFASNVESTVNLSQRILATTFGITTRAIFGKKWKEQEEFIAVVKEAVKVASGFEIADLFPSVKLFRTFSSLRFKLERLHRVSDRLLEKIIGEHKAKRVSNESGKGSAEEDLLDVLLNHLDCDGDSGFSLKVENIKALLLDIVAAGSETSSTAVDWAMAEMMKNPRVLKKAQQEVRQIFYRKGSTDEASLNEMTYLKCVVKEILRLHPSVPLLIPRECREKCEINGYEIPLKTKVIVNAAAIGRDPRYWTEPESFIPERFLDSSVDYKGTNFEYIPFGAGRRMCPGITFGVVNVELPLALLLYHFDWELPDGMKREDVSMDESFGATVRRKHDLHLVPTAYYPSPNENGRVDVK